MKTEPILNPVLKDVPHHVMEAAIFVENWMKENGYTSRWQLMGICSRDHALELQKWEEGGVTEELLRRNDGCLRVGKGCVLVTEDYFTCFRCNDRSTPLYCLNCAGDVLKEL